MVADTGCGLFARRGLCVLNSCYVPFVTAYGVCLLPLMKMFKLFDPNSDFHIIAGANLPHWFQPQTTYFITFRTEDSLPVRMVKQWHAERSAWLAQHGISTSMPNWKDKLTELPEKRRKHFHETFSRQYLENLDKGLGACVLKQPRLSKIVADNLLYFNGDRYHIGDFVVMPNHVHLLVCLLGDTELLKQCRSWKRYTAGKINKELGKTGRFWQEESFDHLVRSPEQFCAIQQYIRKNPSHLQNGEYFLYQI